MSGIVFKQKEKVSGYVYEGSDFCEHHGQEGVEIVGCFVESDSFGVVGSYCVCQACKDAADEKEDNETEICDDCLSPFKLVDMVLWKPYYFSASEGDEPYHICKECSKKETHLERVRQDKEDRDNYDEDEE